MSIAISNKRKIQKFNANQILPGKSRPL